MSMNISQFRAKYYIKPPKNHWRLNTGHFLTHISHFVEFDMAYLSNNGLDNEKMTQNVQR